VKKILAVLTLATVIVLADQSAETQAYAFLEVPVISLENPEGQDKAQVTLYTYLNKTADVLYIFLKRIQTRVPPYQPYLAYGYAKNGKFIFGIAKRGEEIPIGAIEKNGWIAVILVPLSLLSEEEEKGEAMNLAGKIFCQPHYKRHSFGSQPD